MVGQKYTMNQFNIIKIYTIFTQQQDTNSIQVSIGGKKKIEWFIISWENTYRMTMSLEALALSANSWQLMTLKPYPSQEYPLTSMVSMWIGSCPVFSTLNVLFNVKLGSLSLIPKGKNEEYKSCCPVHQVQVMITHPSWMYPRDYDGAPQAKGMSHCPGFIRKFSSLLSHFRWRKFN